MGIESIAVVGPTASGKTRRAVQLAKRENGEIISADSRQLYKGMTIGTGKDLDEYDTVNYHLIDICAAGDKYNLHRYLNDFNIAYADIIRRKKFPIICGGTGMYVENALRGTIMPSVPENRELRERLKNKSLEQLTDILSQIKTLHNTTDVDSVKRAVRAIEIQEYYRNHPEEYKQTIPSLENKLNCLIVGIDIPREKRREKITERLKARLDEGLVDEVNTLLNSGLAAEDLIYYGLEYKYVTLYIIGSLSYSKMVSELEIAIHQFAKRQMTWFRGMEKRGLPINWLSYDMSESDFISAVNKLKEEYI